MSIAELAMLVNDDFDEPLNQQFNNMVGLLGNVDYVYAKIPLGTLTPNKMISHNNGDISNYTVFNSPNEININCNGSIFINCSVKATIKNDDNTYSGNVYGYLKIFKNDVEIGSAYSQFSINKNTSDTFAFNLNDISIAIKKSDVITFKLYLAGQTNINYSYSNLIVNEIKFDDGIIKAIPCIVGKDLIS